MALGGTSLRDRAINGQSVENLVLVGIPNKKFSILAPYLHRVQLENGAVLEREGARIDEVYFLNRGIALMIVETIKGKSVEVGLIGRGSMVGLQVTLQLGLRPRSRGHLCQAQRFSIFGKHHQYVVQNPESALFADDWKA